MNSKYVISSSSFFVLSKNLCLTFSNFPTSMGFHSLLYTRKEMHSSSRFAIESSRCSICEYGFSLFSRFSKGFFTSSNRINLFHLVRSHFFQMRISLPFAHWFLGHVNKISTAYKVFFGQEKDRRNVFPILVFSKKSHPLEVPA